MSARYQIPTVLLSNQIVLTRRALICVFALNTTILRTPAKVSWKSIKIFEELPWFFKLFYWFFTCIVKSDRLLKVNPNIKS